MSRTGCGDDWDDMVSDGGTRKESSIITFFCVDDCEGRNGGEGAPALSVDFVAFVCVPIPFLFRTLTSFCWLLIEIPKNHFRNFCD